MASDVNGIKMKSNIEGVRPLNYIDVISLHIYSWDKSLNISYNIITLIYFKCMAAFNLSYETIDITDPIRIFRSLLNSRILIQKSSPY